MPTRDIIVDGQHNQTLKRSLSADQSWHLDRAFNFRHRVEVSLIDEDSPDPDDELGKVAIGPDITPFGTASFRADGADYRLQYRVEDAPGPELPVDPKAAAEQIVEEFRTTPGGGCWPNISREALAAGMLDRVRNPYNVDQRAGPFCGPSAVVFELVRRDPLRYVQICRSLYNTGSLKSRTE